MVGGFPGHGATPPPGMWRLRRRLAFRANGPGRRSDPRLGGTPEDPMNCEVCGNDYDKSFQVKVNGSSHTFDSFECAIHALAPRCAHCETRILGHGMEKGSKMF